MIEKIVMEHLAAAGIRTVTEIPEGGIAPPFCLVEKTGGRLENRLRGATVAVQSYGETLYAAAALNEEVIAAMDGLCEQPEIAACELNSDYNFTDTTKRKYRYQAVFDIVYY